MKIPVLLPNIFNHPFTYQSDIKLKVGEYVKVPFGKSTMTGVVWDQFEKKTNKPSDIYPESDYLLSPNRGGSDF